MSSSIIVLAIVVATMCAQTCRAEDVGQSPLQNLVRAIRAYPEIAVRQTQAERAKFAATVPAARGLIGLLELPPLRELPQILRRVISYSEIQFAWVLSDELASDAHGIQSSLRDWNDEYPALRSLTDQRDRLNEISRQAMAGNSRALELLLEVARQCYSGKLLQTVCSLGERWMKVRLGVAAEVEKARLNDPDSYEGHRLQGIWEALGTSDGITAREILGVAAVTALWTKESRERGLSALGSSQACYVVQGPAFCVRRKKDANWHDECLEWGRLPDKKYCGAWDNPR